MFLYEPKVKIANSYTVAELRLFDKQDNLLRAIPLAEFTRLGIKELLYDLGFYRKSEFRGEFPEEYRSGVVPPPGGITVEDLVAENFSLCSKYDRISPSSDSTEQNTCS
ncbi:hypothetical protein ScPMuIL_006834 [Solemya velum]